MAIIIDATVGGANSNSYISLEDANTYFSYNLYGENWDNADDETRKKALVSATRRIDYEKFYGYRSSENQSLQFPRAGIGYLDGIYVDNIIPQQISEATCELALYMLSTNMSKPSVNTSNIQSVKAGSLAVEYAIDKNDNVSRPNNELPPFVLALIQDFSNTALSSGFLTVGR